MVDVFLSYTRAEPDRSIVQKVVEALATHMPPISAWSEANLAAGQDYRIACQRQIELAKCFVLIWSRDAGHSQWVRFEIERALKAWSRQASLSEYGISGDQHRLAWQITNTAVAE